MLGFLIFITGLLSSLPIFSNSHSTFENILSKILILFGAMLFGVALFFNLNRSTPRAYNIAIIGFPRSGKTTLITSLFKEIFATRIIGVKAAPRGSTTIERINENMEKLERGRAIGPTEDQTRFSYATNISIKKGLFTTYYKVEFGDFPGDDTEKYVNKYGDWLHKTEFFQWVMECDALIFVIDLAEYLKNYNINNDYISIISKAVRAAWQYYYEFNRLRIKSSELRRRPIVLTFTKVDSIEIYNKYSSSRNNYQQALMENSFGKLVPSVHEIDPDNIIECKKIVLDDFSELIKYLQNESNNFRFVFTSCFGTINGKKIGMEDLISSIFPS